MKVSRTLVLCSAMLLLVACATRLPYWPQINANIEAMKVAAGQGDAEAQFRLAYLLSVTGVIAGGGLEWLEAAANQGHAEAQYELGRWYAAANDLVLPARNKVLAFKWYSLSAVQGFRCPPRRASKYEDAIKHPLPPLDVSLAAHIISKDKTSAPCASEELRKLAKTMTQEETSKAKGLVQNWQPKSDT